MTPIAVGSTVHVPDRYVNAWGKVLEIEGKLARVQISHSATTKGCIKWYPLEQLQTHAMRRAAREGRL